MSDTQEGPQVAPLFSKFPPGPFHLRARIEVARAYAEPDTLFHVFAPVYHSDDPLIAVWSMPDAPLTTGGTFWDGGIAPFVVRLQTDYAPRFRPLLFVTRQGREVTDYNALARQVNRDGMKHDAPTVRFFEETSSRLFGQIIAILPDEAGDTSNG